MNEKHPNEIIVGKFIKRCGLNNPVVHTLNVEGVPARNAYTSSHWDKEKQIGLVAIAQGDGDFLCNIEQVIDGKLRDNLFSNADEAFQQFSTRMAA